mmetsp:Transcript_160061/g.388685  ORF Transcript_160061/g.388685 Transcript_160061/m.388685 type:complete len:82 (+) Transcript_160061:263-508(+)
MISVLEVVIKYVDYWTVADLGVMLVISVVIVVVLLHKLVKHYAAVLEVVVMLEVPSLNQQEIWLVHYQTFYQEYSLYLVTC